MTVAHLRIPRANSTFSISGFTVEQKQSAVAASVSKSVSEIVGQESTASRAVVGRLSTGVTRVHIFQKYLWDSILRARFRPSPPKFNCVCSKVLGGGESQWLTASRGNRCWDRAPRESHGVQQDIQRPSDRPGFDDHLGLNNRPRHWRVHDHRGRRHHNRKQAGEEGDRDGTIMELLDSTALYGSSGPWRRFTVSA